MPSDYEKQAREFMRTPGYTPEPVFAGLLETQIEELAALLESVAPDARAEEREKCAGIAENSGMASGEDIAKRIRAGEAEKGAGE